MAARPDLRSDLRSPQRSLALVALLHAALLWGVLSHDVRRLPAHSNLVYMDVITVTPARRAAAAGEVKAAAPAPTSAAVGPGALAIAGARTARPARAAAVAVQPQGAAAGEGQAATALASAGAASQPFAITVEPKDATAGASAASPADPFAAVAPTASPQRLDVEAMRKLARDDERRRVPTSLERVQDAQRIAASGDTREARAIAQTHRADCRKTSGESTHLDPLLLIPIIYSTLTGTGCKW